MTRAGARAALAGEAQERDCPSVVRGPAREEGGGAAATHRAGTPEEAKPGATPFTTHHTSLQSPPPPPPPPRPRAHVYTFTAPPLQAARGRAQDRAAPSRRRAVHPPRPPTAGARREPRTDHPRAQLRAHPLARRRATRRARAVGDELRRPAVARIVGWSQQGLLLRRRIRAVTHAHPHAHRRGRSRRRAAVPPADPPPVAPRARLGLRRQLPRVARIISRERPTVSPRGGVPSRSTRRRLSPAIDVPSRPRAPAGAGDRAGSPPPPPRGRRRRRSSSPRARRCCRRRAPAASATRTRFHRDHRQRSGPVGPRAWQTACGRAAPRAEPRAGEPPPLSTARAWTVSRPRRPSRRGRMGATPPAASPSSRSAITRRRRRMWTGQALKCHRRPRTKLTARGGAVQRSAPLRVKRTMRAPTSRTSIGG